MSTFHVAAPMKYSMHNSHEFFIGVSLGLIIPDMYM